MVCGTAFLPLIFEMMEWKPESRYRVHGMRRQKGEEVVLFFDMKNAERYIDTAPTDPKDGQPGRAALFADGTKPLAKKFKTTVVASPASWTENFGRKATGGAVPLAVDAGIPWDVDAEGMPYQTDKEISPSTESALQQGIKEIVDTIRRME